MKTIIYILILLPTLCNAQFFSVASASSGTKTGTIPDGGGGSPTSLDSLASQMVFWSDNSRSGSQLLDKSGNGRHATLLTNIISNGDAEYNSPLDEIGSTYVTVNESSTVDAHSGSRCFDIEIDAAVGASGVKTLPYIITAGDTLNWSFWIKRITSSTIFYSVTGGNAELLVNSNCNTATVGVWTQFSGSSVVSQSGGRGLISWQIVNTSADFRLDDITIRINSDTTAFRLPVDTVLSNRDTENIFYDANANPLTIRADYTYGAYHNDLIYQGGAYDYIFTTDTLTAQDDYTVATQFEDLDFPFDSCPKVISVGSSGKDYTTIQAALNSISNNTYLHRTRIEVYDSIVTTTFVTSYPTFASPWYNNVQMTKKYTYITGVGANPVYIFSGKEETVTDSEIQFSKVFSLTLACGLRNFKVEKQGGGYLIHQHYVGTEFSEVIYKDCSFTDLGTQYIVDYRRSQSQDTTGIINGLTPLSGGLEDGFRAKINNCTFQGIYGATWHDNSVDTEKARVFMRDCTINALPIYDYTFNNPPGLVASFKTTSHGGLRPQSIVYLQNCTLNDDNEEVIDTAPKSVFQVVYNP